MRIKIIGVIGLLVCLFGCRTSRPTIKQIETETVKYVLKDSIIREPGDTVRLSTQIPCPDADWEGEVKSTKTTLKASIKNGVLNVDCHTDSLNKRIQWLEKEVDRKQIKIITVVKKVEVPQKYIPKWVWYALLGFSGLTVFSFRKQIFPLAGKLFKLFS